MQEVQFQSITQYRIWGTRISDDGNRTPLNQTVNNRNVMMPRSYSSQNGDQFYSWFAATAEGKRIDENSSIGAMKDSLCPYAWRLPSRDVDSNGSWQNLILSTYHLVSSDTETNQSAVDSLTSFPFMIKYAGYYYWYYGTYDQRGAIARFINNANSRSGWTNTAAFTVDHNGDVMLYSDSSATTGSSVRCVLKNE